jgi:hypothetical protein
MFDNVFIETDAAGNIKPSKKKSSEKIDGAVATIMALDGAIRRSDKAAESSSSVWVFDGEKMYKNNDLWNGDYNAYKKLSPLCLSRLPRLRR